MNRVQENLFFPSIFNDVLAPTTLGPSSSNTVGPWRIGAIVRQFATKPPRHVKIEMSRNGGFFETLYSMCSDKAFVAGILGEDLLKIDFDAIYDIAQRRNLEVTFIFSDRIERIPTEMAELTLQSDSETLTFTAVSLGGGEVVITKLNGQPCEIDGRKDLEVLIPGSDRVCKIRSIYPCRNMEAAVPLFCSSDEMLFYTEREDIPLWEAAIRYEESLTGESREEIWKRAEETLKTSYTSIEKGMTRGITFDGITTAKAANFLEKENSVPQIDLGPARAGSLEALGIMEYSNTHGKIVCMPTGGAAGIIPAAIKNTAVGLKKSFEEQVKALLVAGLIGVFYYPTHYHGALGCQAEVGVAASMAAAGLACMLSEDPAAAERAAVLAMQCFIGQICDPIDGYTQIPCFIRNVASVPLAMTCANYGVLGLDTGVSLDEMAKATLRVGEKIREDRISDCGTCMCKKKL